MEKKKMLHARLKAPIEVSVYINFDFEDNYIVASEVIEINPII